MAIWRSKGTVSRFLFMKATRSGQKLTKEALRVAHTKCEQLCQGKVSKYSVRLAAMQRKVAALA